MIKGIIFDYGGTIDSRGVHWSEIIYEGWRRSGIVAEKSLFREAYVYAERELARVRHILPEHDFADTMYIKVTVELQWLAHNAGFAPEQIAEKAREVARYCDSVARDSVAEARPVLEDLAQRYPLVLVSNFYGNIGSVLRAYGLDTLFGKVIESAVVGVRKPDPAIFRMGVDALGVPAEATLVVGDSVSKDIRPAVSLGCKAVWLKGDGWEGDAAALEAELPAGTGVIDRLSDLPRVMAEM